ncbi:hypothetical protein J1N35_004985 [Gossypium stocksii]|uniref:Uncharacterized protein n=1 Tax=Gossypium stocksii TaxID=47602 RepID=A0A9D3WEG5_9ROSI|nr:hypothetical protein J1N35_004985 [Gossypium stocksii]
MIEKETRRLAVVNMDWRHVKVRSKAALIERGKGEECTEEEIEGTADLKNNQWGNTPVDEAQMCGNKNLIKLLEDAKSTQLSELPHCSKEFTDHLLAGIKSDEVDADGSTTFLGKVPLKVMAFNGVCGESAVKGHDL